MHRSPPSMDLAIFGGFRYQRRGPRGGSIPVFLSMHFSRAMCVAIVVFVCSGLGGVVGMMI